MIGSELALLPDINQFERLYIKVFGVPISGLRIRLRRILPLLNGNPKSVLDAGCGRGMFSIQLAKRFPDAKIIAVDIDEKQLKENRRLVQEIGLKNLHFHQNDVGDLSYHNHFDLILSVDNLEHIEDDRNALLGLADALNEGGKLILHVPGKERRWFFFGYKVNFEVPGHYRPGYTLAEIRLMVESAGLKVKNGYYTFGWLETVANNISYLITKAEAKNKTMYAVVFPILNIVAWLGRNSFPEKGAGVLVVAEKKS